MFVSADSTCLVAGSARPDLKDLLQAFQMNHYCDSISFNDFENIIANYLDKEKVSELIKSLDIDY